MVEKILGSSKAWAPLLAVVILAFFYFLVNFGAAISLARDAITRSRVRYEKARRGTKP